MIPAPLLAVAFVLAGAVAYDPHILTVTWPDGHSEQIAATSRDTCNRAVHAIRLGWWMLPEGVDQVSANCTRGNLFEPAELCIAGYSCPSGRGR